MALQCEMIQHSTEDVTYQISVYHVGTRKLIRSMGGGSAHPYTHLEFTHDDKYLLSLTDHGRSTTLTCFIWMKEKCLATTNIDEVVDRIRGNPSDASSLTLSGPSFFKQAKILSDNNFKITAVTTTPLDSIVDHTWAFHDQIIAVTSNGRLIALGYSPDKGGVEIKYNKVISLPDGCSVETVCAYSKGFIVAGSRGLLYAMHTLHSLFIHSYRNYLHLTSP